MSQMNIDTNYAYLSYASQWTFGRPTSLEH